MLAESKEAALSFERQAAAFPAPGQGGKLEWCRWGRVKNKLQCIQLTHGGVGN